ncbi:unnamed protein product [Adineta steineri]|uniref:Uncharacterized protein n=1 Tax=Adineta steineri TaxID=433720 RepID=A0A819D6L4_9BILA|nr:unnamed protein product [Adineta steineri]CAF1416337.1 unnamed protein product [Adineta steineri]CAF1486652.1 unnamed protein product [Adineta steineri]CAF3832119.1 unnamed protein product [Adineta steineri]
MLMDIKWTPQLTAKWQSFYDNAARDVIFGRSPFVKIETLATLPSYQDLEPIQCNWASRQKASVLFVMVTLIAKKTLVHF